jgi:hypothetical protein
MSTASVQENGGAENIILEWKKYKKKKLHKKCFLFK